LVGVVHRDHVPGLDPLRDVGVVLFHGKQKVRDKRHVDLFFRQAVVLKVRYRDIVRRKVPRVKKLGPVHRNDESKVEDPDRPMGEVYRFQANSLDADLFSFAWS